MLSEIILLAPLTICPISTFILALKGRKMSTLDPNFINPASLP